MSKSSTNDKWRMARFRPAMDFSKVGSFLRSVLCGKGGNKDNQKVGCAGQSWPILFLGDKNMKSGWSFTIQVSCMFRPRWCWAWAPQPRQRSWTARTYTRSSSPSLLWLYHALEIRINQKCSKLNVFSQLFQTLTWTHGKEANSRHVRDVWQWAQYEE